MQNHWTSSHQIRVSVTQIAMKKDSYETLTKNLKAFNTIIAENENFLSVLNEGSRTDSNNKGHRDTENKKCDLTSCM